MDLGGGKAVIIGDARTQKTEAMFRRFGRFVESLNGRYITAEDVGMSTTEMVNIQKETKYVAGLPEEMGGDGVQSGNGLRCVLWNARCSENSFTAPTASVVAK